MRRYVVRIANAIGGQKAQTAEIATMTVLTKTL
jgi:hypothetical protein